ncbi:MAG: hypothetical protein QW051_01470 [Candidatus Aenigmatarchaeota archaeon]
MVYERKKFNNNIMEQKLHEIGLYTRNEVKKALENYCSENFDGKNRCNLCKKYLPEIGNVCNGKNENGEPKLKRNWLKLLKEGLGYEAVQSLTQLGYLPKKSDVIFYQNVFNSPELLYKLKKAHSKKVKQSVIDKMVDELYLCRRTHGSRK